MDTVLIFDYDGVIVDSLEIFMRFFINACQNHGWKQISSKKEFLLLFHGNMYQNMAKLGMKQQDILNVVSEVKKGLLINLEKLPLFPDMKQTLTTLSETNILCISTSNDTTVVKNYLKIHELTCFDHIYGSDVHPSKIKKIELIKQRYQAQRFFYIGDTIGDIKEGKEARVKTIGVTWGWHTRKQLHQCNPDYLIDKVTDLIAISTMTT
jgi:phosphoglycolate phosphatase